MVIINLKGRLTVTPDIQDSAVIETDFQDASAMLEDDSHYGKKVIVSAAGNMAFKALKLAFKHDKDAYINGQMLDVVSNKKEKLSPLQKDLVLLSLCIDSSMLYEAQFPVVDKLVRSVPCKMSKEEALKKISEFAPAIKGATAQLNKLFEERLENRIQKNRDRLSIEADGEKIIKLEMPIADVHKYIMENEGIFVINWDMGAGKTENVTKKLFAAANEKMRALLITSSITLTNALCPEDNVHNYRKALSDGIGDKDKLNKLASTMNSALLKGAFEKTRQLADMVIFEEYEACRDSIIAEIMGDGSLEERVIAQTVFNEMLRKKRVVCVDAHFSKQSADHITKRTGRPIFVIEPTDFDAKYELPKVLYNSDRNAAIELLANNLSDNKVAAAYCDGKHNGAKSKVRATQIQIENLTDKELNNVLVDAEFFTREGNKDYLADITKLYEEHDLVISTPATRNGCSSMAQCDLVSLLMHQTMSPIDVLQTSRRNRLAGMISLNIRESSRVFHTDHVTLFEAELAKNIKAEAVTGTRARLINNDAKNDLIERIAYNNEMRDQYENNVLDMFAELGYEIEFDYEEASRGAEMVAAKAEKAEAREDYKLLDSIRKMRHVADIQAKPEEIRGMREKRVLYAHEVYSFYNIDHEDENFDKVFNFDRDKAGQKFLNNLKLVRSGLDSDYYETASREIVFKKMFEILGINPETLEGDFSKQKFDAFKKWVLSGRVEMKGNADASVLKLVQTFIMSDVKKKQSVWVVKNILKEYFGLNVEAAMKFSKTKQKDVQDHIKNEHTGKLERAYRIVRQEAELTNEMYLLAFPSSAECLEESDILVDVPELSNVEAELEAQAAECLFELQLDSIEFMPDSEHFEAIRPEESLNVI